MKSLKKMNFAGIMFLAILLFVSCNKDESTVAGDNQFAQEESFETADLQASDESEMISEEIMSIGEEVFATDEILSTSKGSYHSDFLPDCVTITTVITSTTKEKTIDFGDGCELPNGNVLSGIIYLSYSKDMELAVNTLSLSLESFTFNGVAVEGGATIERMRSNDNGNPQSDAVAEFSAEWPNGNTTSFTGNRTREWIEGFGSGFWGDNVFLITGKGTYVGPAGNIFVKEVIESLRREMACRFIVSGVLEISTNDETASLDFGDGSCDAVGVLTYPNGESKEILLRRVFN